MKCAGAHAAGCSEMSTFVKRREVERHKATYAIFDSIVRACSDGNPMDADTVARYLAVPPTLRVFSLHLAHITKGAIGKWRRAITATGWTGCSARRCRTSAHVRCWKSAFHDADRLKREVERSRAQYAVFDSVAPACGGNAVEAEVVTQYTATFRQPKVGSLHASGA